MDLDGDKSESPYDWRGIICLIFFLITSKLLIVFLETYSFSFRQDLVVMFPFQFHIPLPRRVLRKVGDFLTHIRILSRRANVERVGHSTPRKQGVVSEFYWQRATVSFQSAPLFAVLFLLSTTAIGPNTVRAGIVGENGVQPLNVLALFISLVCFTLIDLNHGLERPSFRHTCLFPWTLQASSNSSHAGLREKAGPLGRNYSS